MAVAIILTIIAFTISFQEIRGQTNLANNGPSNQNNMNQGFPTNSAKSAADFTQNSGNLGTNINSQLQPNLPQTLASSLTMPSLFSLQPQQSMQQLLNQQQVAFQQINPGQSFLQQSLLPSTSLIQQNPSLQQPNAFIPAFNQFSYSQQLPISGHLVNVPSLSISNPTSTIVSTYPSIPGCACTQTGFVPNNGNSYLSPLSSIPITERPQIITSYSTLPYTSLVSSNPSFTNNAILPYQNQFIGGLNNPLIENKLMIDEQETPDHDNINDLILSLLQTPKQSTKILPFPYAPLQSQKGSKSSQLKSLLPVIFNLLKEKRERCNCDNSCKCKRRSKKGSEPQISTGYSKKKEYSSHREGMYKNNSEENQRNVKDHKRFNKIRKTIDESNESSEYEDFFEDDK